MDYFELFSFWYIDNVFKNGSIFITLMFNINYFSYYNNYLLFKIKFSYCEFY